MQLYFSSHILDATVFIAEHEKEPVFVPDTGNTWFNGYHKQEISPRVVETIPIGKPFIPDKHSIYKIYDKNVEDGPLNDFFAPGKLDDQTSYKKSPEPLDKKDGFLEDSLYGVRLTGDISGLANDDLPSIMKGSTPERMRAGLSKIGSLENIASLSRIHMLESNPINLNFQPMVFHDITGTVGGSASFSQQEPSSSYITTGRNGGIGQSIVSEVTNNREAEKPINNDSGTVSSSVILGGQNEQMSQATYSSVDDSQYHVESNIPSEIYSSRDDMQGASQNSGYQVNSPPITSVTHSVTIPSVVNAHDVTVELKDDGGNFLRNQNTMNAIHIYTNPEKNGADTTEMLPTPSSIGTSSNDAVDSVKETNNKFDELSSKIVFSEKTTNLQNKETLKTTTSPGLKQILKGDSKHHHHQITIDTDTGEVVREETPEEDDNKQHSVVKPFPQETQLEKPNDQSSPAPSSVGAEEQHIMAHVEKAKEVKLKKPIFKENEKEEKMSTPSNGRQSNSERLSDGNKMPLDSTELDKTPFNEEENFKETLPKPSRIFNKLHSKNFRHKLNLHKTHALDRAANEKQNKIFHSSVHKINKISKYNSNDNLDNPNDNHDNPNSNLNSEDSDEGDLPDNKENLQHNTGKTNFEKMLRFPILNLNKKLRYSSLIHHPNNYLHSFKPEFNSYDIFKKQSRRRNDKNFRNSNPDKDILKNIQLSEYDKENVNDEDDDNPDDLINDENDDADLISSPIKALTIFEENTAYKKPKSIKFAHRRHETNNNGNELKNVHANNEKKNFDPEKHHSKFNAHNKVLHHSHYKEYEVGSDNEGNDLKEKVYHIHNHVHNEQHIHIHKGDRSGEKGGFRYLRLHKVGSTDHEHHKSPESINRAENNTSFSDSESNDKEDERSDEDADREAMELLKSYAKSRNNHFSDKGIFNISTSADDYERNNYGDPERNSGYSSQRSETNVDKITKSQKVSLKVNDSLEEEENNAVDDPAFGYSKMVDQLRYQSNKPQSFLSPSDDSDHLHVDETEPNKFEDNDYSNIKRRKKNHRYYFEPKIKKAKEVVEPTYMVHGDPHGDGFGSAVIDGPAELGGSSATSGAKSGSKDAESGTVVSHLHEEVPKGIDGSKRNIPPSSFEKTSNSSSDESNSSDLGNKVEPKAKTNDQLKLNEKLKEEISSLKVPKTNKEDIEGTSSAKNKDEIKVNNIKAKDMRNEDTENREDEKLKENFEGDIKKAQLVDDSFTSSGKNRGHDRQDNKINKSTNKVMETTELSEENKIEHSNNNNYYMNESENRNARALNEVLTTNGAVVSNKEVLTTNGVVVNNKDVNDAIADKIITKITDNSIKERKKKDYDAKKGKNQKSIFDAEIPESYNTKNETTLNLKNIKVDQTDKKKVPDNISSQNNENNDLSFKAQSWLNEISNESNSSENAQKDDFNLTDVTSAQLNVNGAEKDDSKLMKLVQHSLKKNTTVLRSSALKQFARDIFSPKGSKNNFTRKNISKELLKNLKPVPEVERYNLLHMSDERPMFKEVQPTLANVKDTLMNVDLDGIRSLDSKIKSMNFQFNNIEDSNFVQKLKLDLDTKSTNFLIPDHQKTLPLLNPGHPDDINGLDKKKRNLRAKFNILLNPSPTIAMSKSNSQLIPQPYKFEKGFDKSIIFRHSAEREVKTQDFRDQAMKIKGNENDLQLQPFFIASHLKKSTRASKKHANQRKKNPYSKDSSFGLRYFNKKISLSDEEILPVKLGKQNTLKAYAWK